MKIISSERWQIKCNRMIKMIILPKHIISSNRPLQDFIGTKDRTGLKPQLPSALQLLHTLPCAVPYPFGSGLCPSSFCPSSMSPSPLLARQCEKWRNRTALALCSAAQQQLNIAVLSAQYWSQFWSTAPYKLLWRKFPPSQPKPLQLSKFHWHFYSSVPLGRDQEIGEHFYLCELTVFVLWRKLTLFYQVILLQNFLLCSRGLRVLL